MEVWQKKVGYKKGIVRAWMWRSVRFRFLFSSFLLDLELLLQDGSEYRTTGYQHCSCFGCWCRPWRELWPSRFVCWGYGKNPRWFVPVSYVHVIQVLLWAAPLWLTSCSTSSLRPTPRTQSLSTVIVSSSRTAMAVLSNTFTSTFWVTTCLWMTWSSSVKLAASTSIYASLALCGTQLRLCFG